MNARHSFPNENPEKECFFRVFHKINKNIFTFGCLFAVVKRLTYIREWFFQIPGNILKKFNHIKGLKKIGGISDELAINKPSTTAFVNCRWIRNRAGLALWVMMATVAGGTLMSDQACASGSTKHYNIAAQSLNNALMKFTTDSNLELIFNADMVRGLNTKHWTGNMLPAQELQQ